MRKHAYEGLIPLKEPGKIIHTFPIILFYCCSIYNVERQCCILF